MNTVIALSGSPSRNSIHDALLAEAHRLDARVRPVSLRDFPAPLYSPDLEQEQGIPATIRDLAEQLAAADAVIIASPEHNGLPPAILKNAIDWLSRAGDMRFLGGKPLALLSSSPGAAGGANNLKHLAGLAGFWGGEVVAQLSVPRFHDVYDLGQGKFRDADQAAALAAWLQKLTDRLPKAA